MKSKKILGLLLVITLLSASVFGSINVFAASGDTHVALESYMPPVKTLFVDDDFQNRAVDEVVSNQPTGGQYTHPISAAGNGIKAEKNDESDTNIYAKYNTGYQTIEYISDNLSNVENLAVSFKAVIPASGNSIRLRFGSSYPAFLFQRLSDGKIQTKIYTSASANTVITNKVTGELTDWFNVDIILKKGSNDNIQVKEIRINNEKQENTNVTMELYSGCNWRSAKNVGIQSTDINVKVDDILIYEPQTVYFKDVTQTGLTIVNDSSEPVTGNLFLALYDTDGNLLTANPYGSDVTVAAGESQTITAPTGITYPTGVAKAKIFYWNGTTLAPLCYSADVPLS